jgi:4-hydroxy-3-methylbut-2-enyl diphosphate reductase
LEEKFKTFFITNEADIESIHQINTFDIHKKAQEVVQYFLPIGQEKIRVAITSGASCPDAVVDGVIQKILALLEITTSIDDVLTNQN